MSNNHRSPHRRLTGSLAVAAAVMVAACADSPAGLPLAPRQGPALGLSAKDAPYDADGDGKLSDEEKAAQKRAEREAKDTEEAAKDSAKAAKKAADDSVRAARRLSKDEFERLKAEWKAYKKAVEDGDVRAEGLRCEPSPGRAVTKTIGAKGGSIDVGSHTITIPQGALAADVAITAADKAGPHVELEFQPHGLSFAKPVELTFDYEKCVVPQGALLDVVYVGASWRVLETMPSSDRRAERTISALTDHFSGYLVAWGRNRGAAY